MTINTSTRTAGPFTGNGVTIAFPFSYKVFARSDVLVARTVTATAVETVLTLDSDYAVVLNSDQNANPGGTIQMMIAPPVGTTLAATSNLLIVQNLDLTNNGGFYPTAINNALDRIVITIQQLAARVGAGALNVGASARIDSILNTLTNFASATGSTLVGFLQAGVGAVLQTIQQKHRQSVHVMDFMTDAQRADYMAGGLTLDLAVAFQAAIDAVSPTQGSTTRAGTVIADPRYPALVQTTINATNSRVAGTLVRDGLRLVGFNLVGKTGAGNAVIETTGSQWLEGDLIITTTGAAGSSTVGVMQAISAVLPQTQNQKLKLRILMHDDVTANGGAGTVGVWVMGAEENTFDTNYIQANVPLFCTGYKVSPNYTSVIPPSFQAPLLATHSCGVNTWSGETFLVSLGQQRPSLITEDVNSMIFENLYMANIGTGGTNLDAWRQYGAFQGGTIQGTIEQHTGIRVVGVISGAKLRFTFGGLISLAAERITLVRGGQGRIVDCDIDMQDNVSSNRPLLTATPVSANELITCYLRNVRIRCSADKQYLALPENLLWNPNTGSVVIEGVQNGNNPYRYTVEANRAQSVAIPLKTVLINGGITGAEVVRFILPTISGAANALGASVRIRGIATILGSGTGAMSIRYVDAVVAISLSQTGAITAAIGNVFGGVQADTNAPGNSITAVALSAVAAGTYIQLVVSPTRTGANNESVQFTGTAEMIWTGNESRAPSLQIP